MGLSGERMMSDGERWGLGRRGSECVGLGWDGEICGGTGWVRWVSEDMGRNGEGWEG